MLSEIHPHIEIGTDMQYSYIANLESEDGFIKQLGLALSHTESKKDILEERRPFLKKYTIGTTANNYVDFYNKVLESI